MARDDTQQSFWFVVRVRTQTEKAVSRVLFHKGYETFLPVYKSRRQWSDRMKEMEVPFFPGYLFCRFNINDSILPILTAPGVVNVVGERRRPTPVDQREMDSLQAALARRLRAVPFPFFPGSTVRIERGPLAGLEGVVVRLSNSSRLVLAVTLLQRAIAVEIDPKVTTLLWAASPEGNANGSSQTGQKALAASAGVGV